MKSYDENEVIYYLTMADLQRVAEDSLNRKLTEYEIEKVIDKLPDYISWYESINYTIEEIFAK
ncbi:MAG: hypothetical protein Q8Q50_16030 [Methylobacter sp.]|nr:hypothetical protein [Methylobacter sp.]